MAAAWLLLLAACAAVAGADDPPDYSTPRPGFCNWTEAVEVCVPFGDRVTLSFDFLICDQCCGWVGIHFLSAFTVFLFMPALMPSLMTVALIEPLEWFLFWVIAQFVDINGDAFHRETLGGTHFGDMLIQHVWGLVAGGLFVYTWQGPALFPLAEVTGRSRNDTYLRTLRPMWWVTAVLFFLFHVVPVVIPEVAENDTWNAGAGVWSLIALFVLLVVYPVYFGPILRRWNPEMWRAVWRWRDGHNRARYIGDPNWHSGWMRWGYFASWAMVVVLIMVNNLGWVYMWCNQWYQSWWWQGVITLAGGIGAIVRRATLPPEGRATRWRSDEV